MLSYLSKPYPSIQEDGYRKSLIINVTVSLVVFFILYVFKPSLFFEETVLYTLEDCLMFAGITFVVSFFYTNILTRLLPKTFDTSTWTVGKEILMLFLILLSIAIVNFLVGREVYPGGNFNINTFIQVILATFIIGVIPMIVVVAFYLYYHQKKLSEKARSINASITTKNKEELPTLKTKAPKTTKASLKRYTLNGTGKYEQLEIEGNQLLFIESIGNYCDIYYWQDDHITKTTFRATLASLNDELPTDQFLKTHRSYLVNLNKVDQVSGNAQGYQLKLKRYNDRTIPVSRANIPTFDQFYK